MKYKVVGTYTVTEEVNTETTSFQEFAQRELSWDSTLTEQQLVIEYAKTLTGDQIIDDDGHGTVVPSSFDWEVEVKDENTKS